MKQIGRTNEISYEPKMTVSRKIKGNLTEEKYLSEIADLKAQLEEKDRVISSLEGRVIEHKVAKERLEGRVIEHKVAKERLEALTRVHIYLATYMYLWVVEECTAKSAWDVSIPRYTECNKVKAYVEKIMGCVGDIDKEIYRDATPSDLLKQAVKNLGLPEKLKELHSRMHVSSEILFDVKSGVDALCNMAERIFAETSVFLENCLTVDKDLVSEYITYINDDVDDISKLIGSKGGAIADSILEPLVGAIDTNLASLRDALNPGDEVLSRIEKSFEPTKAKFEKTRKVMGKLLCDFGGFDSRMRSLIHNPTKALAATVEYLSVNPKLPLEREILEANSKCGHNKLAVEAAHADILGRTIDEADLQKLDI